MIAHVRGTLLSKEPTRLVVSVGGLGLEILTPLPTSQSVGDPGSEVALHVVLVVREDSLTLYGFHTPEGGRLFRKLIGVSGIGPKTALGALSGSSQGALVEALRQQDLGFLTRLPGVGKKTAERMAVELKDSLTEFEEGVPADQDGISERDAVSALVSLGYTRGAAIQAVRQAARTTGGKPDVEQLVRVALTRLSGGKA